MYIYYANIAVIPVMRNSFFLTQVDLEFLHTIHTVATQGCSFIDYWVTSFAVSYTVTNADEITYIQDKDGRIKVRALCLYYSLIHVPLFSCL